jgi:hypothetical protein
MSTRDTSRSSPLWTFDLDDPSTEIGKEGKSEKRGVEPRQLQHRDTAERPDLEARRRVR